MRHGTSWEMGLTPGGVPEPSGHHPVPGVTLLEQDQMIPAGVSASLTHPGFGSQHQLHSRKSSKGIQELWAAPSPSSIRLRWCPVTFQSFCRRKCSQKTPDRNRLTSNTHKIIFKKKEKKISKPAACTQGLHLQF